MAISQSADQVQIAILLIVSHLEAKDEIKLRFELLGR